MSQPIVELASQPPIVHNNRLSPTNNARSITRDPVDRSPNITPPLKPIEQPIKTNNQSVKPVNQSRSSWLYYRWVNPWIRWLFIIVILYVYALTSGVLTYRNNVFQAEMQYLLNIKWKEAYGGDTTTLPPSTRPTREEGESYQIYHDGQIYTVDGYVPFILKDLWFEFIPATQGSLRERWNGFVDSVPIIANIVMFLMLIARRDVIRLTEYIAIQMIMFSVNALVHVSTTYPDSAGQQSNCKDIDRQEYGSWMFRLITTSYCGDMLWSGHTANSIVPFIIIRRLMWDYIGWNVTWSAADEAPNAETRNEYLSKHSQLFSGWHNAHERNQLFLQWMKANRVHDQRDAAAASSQYTAPPATTNLESYAPSYPDARPTAAQKGTADPEIVADELALQEHENHDIHINVAAATAVGPDQAPNTSSDVFFKVYKSPYSTPAFVQKHRKAFWIGTTIIRFLLLVWITFLLIGIILIRYHYSNDVIIACFVSMLVCTNTHLLQWFVRILYRPNYTNYLSPRAFWKPVYLHWPLNDEQINYEERVRRVGIGGII